MSFEYKCVGAPERIRRQRGVRSRSDRVALAMQEIIANEAVDGWEYLRTDLVPVEEKPGLFSRIQEVHRAVLVFRRDMGARQRERTARGVAAVFDVPQRPATEERSEPEAWSGNQPQRERRLPLSAERDEPPPPPRPIRPPSGLG